MSINTVEYANQLLAENADLKKQVQELKSRLQLVSELSDAAAALHVEAEKQVQALAAERDEAINSHRNHAARLIDERGQLRQRLVAAEAQVKELTADLDKESEIRHRIHEELNAIKGAQQPVAEIKWNGSELIVQNVSDAFSFGVTEVYTHPAPAVLPPVVDSWHNSASHIMSSLQFNGDETSFTVGANWMRQQVLDMGAKPLPVIEFDGADMDSARGITGEGDEYCRGFIDGLLDGADQVRAAGLEVKS